MIKGQKHIVGCRCILPQFKRQNHPPTHRFVVFSELDKNDNVIVKFVQCNNCRTIHKIIGLCQSEIMHGKEHMRSVKTLDEIKASIPERLLAILDTNHVDQASYESVQFIIDNQLWGEHVVLVSDEDAGLRQGKFVRILSETLFKVDTFASEILVKEDND